MNRLLFLALLTACKAKTIAPPETPPIDTQAQVLDFAPLVAEWTGPYGGVPPLDKVKPSMFAPGVRAAMELHTQEMSAIANNPDPPTVENVIEPMERAGSALGRAGTMLGVWESTMSSEEVRAVLDELAPEMSAHSSAVWQDRKLYDRVKGLSDNAELNTAQRRLVDDYLSLFMKSGVTLDDTARARVAAIDQELSVLYNGFSNHLLADEEGHRTKLGKDDLSGLPQTWLEGSADPDAPDTWWVRNTRSSVDPFLTYSERRDLREKVWRAFTNRGDNGDANDNNEMISKILALRNEKAKLLGFESFAHFQLHDKMAKTPEAAISLLERVYKPSAAKFRAEVKAMQGYADKQRGAKFKIEPWDVKFYAEKIRQRDFALEAKEITPYLQLENLREAMFWAAGRLYGFQFEAVTDVPVQHADVRVWAVKDPDGSLRGLWYFDPYAREGKRSGAWMNAYRVQQDLDPAVPIVTNQSNFVKPAAGKVATISWDDAETLFHEFGHALHGLSSDVRYPSQAGTSTKRDFVEFPSQLNESWLSTPELLQKYALHVDTNEPMPADLVKRIQAASNATTGFNTTELLASALVDMKIHLAQPPIDADTFETETLADLDLPAEIVMRHRLPQFAHVFAGDGYSAGYYSYVWADVLTADAAEAFEEAGSYYDEKVAKAYFDHVLSVGDTVDPSEAFKTFRGRDPDVKALLRKKGFPTK